MSEPVEKVFNVLFLCTGNSARSIMAEAITNRAGQGRFSAYSAGSQPKGQVHPYTLDLLQKLNFDISKLRSKNWNEFAKPGAPARFRLHCLRQRRGRSLSVLAGSADDSPLGRSRTRLQRPVTKPKFDLAFADTMRMLSNRINIFMALAAQSDRQVIVAEKLDEIGHTRRMFRPNPRRPDADLDALH